MVSEPKLWPISYVFSVSCAASSPCAAASRSCSSRSLSIDGTSRCTPATFVWIVWPVVLYGLRRNVVPTNPGFEQKPHCAYGWKSPASKSPCQIVPIHSGVSGFRKGTNVPKFSSTSSLDTSASWPTAK